MGWLALLRMFWTEEGKGVERKSWSSNPTITTLSPHFLRDITWSVVWYHSSGEHKSVRWIFCSALLPACPVCMYSSTVRFPRNYSLWGMNEYLTRIRFFFVWRAFCFVVVTCFLFGGNYCDSFRSHLIYHLFPSQFFLWWTNLVLTFFSLYRAFKPS